MSKIKFNLIALVFWFIGLTQMSVLLDGMTLHPLIYAYIFGIAAVMFLFPILGKQDLALSTVVTQTLHITTFGFVSLVTGGPELPLFFVGAFVVQITLLIMRGIASPMADFNAAAETFVLGTSGLRMLPRTEGEEAINHELYRARRFERPFSVVYCRLPEAAAIKDSSDVIETDFINWHITKNFKDRYQRAQLVKLISSLTYKSDTIVEHGDGIIIGLPETESEQTTVFVNQLGSMVTDTLGINPIIGAAHFPDEGLVYENLSEQAQSTATLWYDDKPKDDTLTRNGDVMVGLEERRHIEEVAEWVNKMPHPTPEGRKVYQVLKRAFDIAAVTLSLPIILPVMAVVGLLIFLEDGDTIFYMQGRTGYGGERFQMYKFRSMYVNSAAIPPTEVVLADGSVRYMWPEKVEDDPRITHVGRFLRKTSLDELPQLLNVLKGDMSLVGPRPTTWELDKYTAHQTERLSVRPGITGLWQVSARDSTNFDERLLWDMKYIDKANLWMDILIIWKTVMQVFKKGGV